MPEPLVIAHTGKTRLALLPALANRHGLIAGATGTGKTVTLQRMAQEFSRSGVPVFMADVKGDLSGLAQAGAMTDRLKERLELLGIKDFPFAAAPVVFWCLFGKSGHPVRATVFEMGPLLLARILNLNEIQQGVLSLVFKIADDEILPILDMKDLRAMLQHIGDNARNFTTEYGNISAASVGTIQRGLLELERQGGDLLFGEPALDIADLMQTDTRGQGVINILSADSLMNSPKLYSTFLLWLLSELFEHLPEVGDPDKPKLVFFFDEAHLLFTEAPKALVERIEQVIRLIRSKGVGVYFVTQNPLDIPETVLGQLGNRVQHALRAFTPSDQKAVKAAANTMRANRKLNVEKVITELSVGEALVSFLDTKGTPCIVERAFVLPPASRIGPATAAERDAVIKASVLFGHYEKAIDRESAYEKLMKRTDSKLGVDAPSGAGSTRPPDGQASNGEEQRQTIGGRINDFLFGTTGPRGAKHDGIAQQVVKSVAREYGRKAIRYGLEHGTEILRGILGSISVKGSVTKSPLHGDANTKKGRLPRS